MTAFKAMNQEINPQKAVSELESWLGLDRGAITIVATGSDWLHIELAKHAADRLITLVANQVVAPGETDPENVPERPVLRRGASVSPKGLGSLQNQLAEAHENLRLIQEQKTKFVLSTDIPLQLIKEERQYLDKIAELERQLAQLEEKSAPQISWPETWHIRAIREISPIANETEEAYFTKSQMSHTFRVALSGPVKSSTDNQLSLIVENTGSQNYQRVTLELLAPYGAVLLHPTLWRFPLRANSNKATNVSLWAGQPGAYHLQVHVSSIPSPADGFLHTTLPLIVQPPPKVQVEIKYASMATP